MSEPCRFDDRDGFPVFCGEHSKEAALCDVGAEMLRREIAEKQTDISLTSLIGEVRSRWFGGDTDVWIALSFAGEMGELCNLIKKENRVTAPSFRYLQEQVSEEIIDCLFYLLRLADQRSIDLHAAWQRKMKLNDEKYGTLAAAKEGSR